jgi:hypothetical protein
MAVIFNNLQKLSSTLNSNYPKIWGYTDTSVTLAAMVASTFFNDFIGTTELEDGDLFLAKGSDGEFLYKYVVTAGNTSLVSPIDLQVEPFVYRYALDVEIDISIAAPIVRFIPIPRAGILRTITGVVREGTSVSEDFVFDYRGTEVAIFNFNVNTQGTAVSSSTLSTVVEKSGITTPQGLTISVTSASATQRIYAFVFEIEVKAETS